MRVKELQNGRRVLILNHEPLLVDSALNELYVGYDHHLDRAQVAQLVGILQHWLDTGRLPEPGEVGK